jgi:hypothetical protein
MSRNRRKLVNKRQKKDYHRVPNNFAIIYMNKLKKEKRKLRNKQNGCIKIMKIIGKLCRIPTALSQLHARIR